MVLECLISPKNAAEEPYKLLPVTMLFVSVGIAVYLLIPGLNAGFLMFALIPLLPLMLQMLSHEERSEEQGIRRHDVSFLTYHGLLIESYTFVFVGAMLACAIWYAVLPPDVAKTVFSGEISEIGAIQTTVADVMAATGHVAASSDFFSMLFWHNMQVLGLMFAFSILYGVGSLYLLLWNASVLGVFTGMRIAKDGLPGFFNAFLGLLPHGMFEISAYFIASIAGGILSIAVMRHRSIERPELKLVLLDAVFLSAVAVVLLFIGALVESSY